MILNSFKNRFEMLMEGIFTLPQKLDISNYTEVLSGGFWDISQIVCCC